MNKKLLMLSMIFIFAFILCGSASAVVVNEPNVTSVDPVNNAVNVSTNKVIRVTFNEDVKAGNNWIELQNGSGMAVPITKTITGNVLTIDHVSPLNSGIKYTLLLHTGSVTDLSGNGLAAYVSSFTTDNSPPIVTLTDPSNSAVNVPVNKVIQITFNEPIKAGNNWIELQNGSGMAVPITKTITGNVLTIDHVSPLNSGIRYTLLLHTGSVTDLSGNGLAAYVSSFTTDNSPPIVTLTDPSNSAVNVPVNKVIQITFNEPIKAGNNWIELQNSSGLTPFIKSISGSILTITPTSALAESKYTLLIHTGSVTDISGNPVASKISSFSVGTSPTINGIDPVKNAVNIARNKVITVTFNEPIKNGNGWMELLSNSGTIIPITKSISGNLLTITHAALLTGTKYNILLHTGSLTDLAGNPQAVYVSSFTTSTDATPPIVTTTDPSNSAVNVPVNKVIQITFNEPIKAGTNWIELLSSNGTAVLITKTISGNVLTIGHVSPLNNGIRYTIVLHTGSITDISGNNINSYTSGFTTANDYNTNPPSDTVKLTFIHHSCGGNWLAGGNLGSALNANNYYVTDTNYGWGPSMGSSTLGDHTNTDEWDMWFNDTQMPYVYTNTATTVYPNTITDQGGENEIIMFKSCFPCSEVGDSIDDEKAIYNNLKTYFAAHPNKLFVFITPPGEINVESYQLTRDLCNWLVDKETGWLAGYTGKNVFAFDFYGVLSEVNSHHRYVAGNIEHVYASDYDGNSPYHDVGNDHPNDLGNQKATNEFIPLLNIAYNWWKS